MRTKAVVVAAVLTALAGLAASGQEAEVSAGLWDKVTDIDAKLQNAPFGVLVFLALAALNSVLAWAHWFPDKAIPGVSMGAAVVGMLLLAPHPADAVWRVWVGKNLFIGVISGTAAWMAGRKFGKPVVDRLFGQSDGPPPPAALLVLCCGLALGAAGCGTLPADQSQRVATSAKVAAMVGTAEAVAAHPEWRPKFVAAANELSILANADHVDVATLLAVVQSLPVAELKSPRAKLVVTAVTLVLSDYAGSLPLNRLDELKPVAAALKAGVELGLASVPEEADP